MNAIAITFATLLAVASAGPNGAPAAIAKPQLTLATPSIAYSAKVVSPNAKLIRVGRGIVGAPAVLAAPSVTYSSGIVRGAPLIAAAPTATLVRVGRGIVGARLAAPVAIAPAPLAYAVAPALVHAPVAIASAPLAVKSIAHGPLLL